ncbi:MAG: hypothetical protein QMC77_08815 [Methanocellales archaeon]|nr:hypothetical protein [Methanocellales archaeon]
MPEKFKLKRIGRDEFILKIEDFEIILSGDEAKQLQEVLFKDLKDR